MEYVVYYTSKIINDNDKLFYFQHNLSYSEIIGKK